MKKIVFGTLSLIVLLSLGFYYYRERAAGPDDLAPVDEVLKHDDSETSKTEDPLPNNPSAEKKIAKQNDDKKNEKEDDDDDLAEDMLGQNEEGSGNPQNERSLNEEEADKMTAYFEATEKAWNERMEHFIINELHMPVKALQEYKVLREGYDRDKMEAFEDFHKYMRDKHGDSYSYNPTQDEEKFAGKVKEKYDSKLRELFGQENYLQYREELSEFNKKRKAEQNPEIGVLFMDI